MASDGPGAAFPSRRAMPDLGAADAGAAVARFLAKVLVAESVELTATPLSGGAIQENWRLDVTVCGGPSAGRHCFVLRRDAPSSIEASHDRAAEFALLSVAFAAGVTVPEPIALCRDPSVLGSVFAIMRFVEGTAAGHILTQDRKWSGDRPMLGRRLGRELARLHAIAPPEPRLSFLPAPASDHAAACIAAYDRFLDQQARSWPALRWGLRWLDRNRPPPARPVLLHRDFRTGNYLCDDKGLAAILDWEFAGWGDAREDIGWLCARCWRFAAPDREAGGVAARAEFYAGYEAESGKAIDRAAIGYWEVMAAMRWAVIAIQQANRHIAGGEIDLALALTGRRTAELAWDILAQTAILDGEDARAVSVLTETAGHKISLGTHGDSDFPRFKDRGKRSSGAPPGGVAVSATMAPPDDIDVEWPAADDLLATAAAALRATAAGLSGASRYQVLMAANAVAIGERHLKRSPGVAWRIATVLAAFDPDGTPGSERSWDAIERSLDAALRSGAIDHRAEAGGRSLRHALADATAARLSLSNPRHIPASPD